MSRPKKTRVKSIGDRKTKEDLFAAIAEAFEQTECGDYYGGRAIEYVNVIRDVLREQREELEQWRAMANKILGNDSEAQP